MKNFLHEKKLMEIIEKNNKNWGIKILVTWFSFILVFFLCFIFKDMAEIIGHFVAKYIPMVDKFIRQPTDIGDLPANYFAALSILIPVFSLWIALGDDVLARCRYGNSRLGRGKLETFVFVYVLSAPALAAIIYMAYFAPFSFSGPSKNFGQQLFILMLNTNIGLLVLGSFAGLVVSQIFVFLLWLFWLPIQYFFFNSLKE